MKTKVVLASVVAVALAWMSASLLAHHGDAGRYEDKLTTVKGIVIELQLINPHSVVVLDVTEDGGKLVRWRGEAGSSTQLKGWCWTKDVIKPGDTVTMIGRRLKNGSPYMTLSENSRVIDAGGKEIYKGNDPGQPNQPGPCAPARTSGGR
ncbi:MAG: hypothetical protein AUH72_20830 [Acidobacteria bacterium 13_1_40CM_4_65_8]|nr:MAG: hypothetical protein AUH72_20830 [Acidobacteria bacterium 13_1_40CM_4_65_8]OLE80332.1 MAG: hypothetical protein AUF76_14960 [Acidobacteria bacterium 13_1_20CM_2_65_9]